MPVGERRRCRATMSVITTTLTRGEVYVDGREIGTHAAS